MGAVRYQDSPRNKLKRILVGQPIDNARAHTERVGPLIGLPVFSSDALSSVAYATEAILGILVLYGVAGGNLGRVLGWQLWISIGIVALIAIVTMSYNQTIHAYPSGGGSYIVASENLGQTPGLVAAAALLVDYVLTVSVSVAAGTEAVVSAFPMLHAYSVPMAIACVLVIAWANLRGLKESGALFAVPVYSFIAGMAIMIFWGAFKAFATKDPTAQHVIAVDPDTMKSLIGRDASMPLLFMVCRAFAAGCTALTGIEAVSNGVQAFREPVSDNASKTLRYMAVLLGFMFIGVSFLIKKLPTLTLYDDRHSVVSQVAAWTFGAKNPGFYFIQFATAAILILAANTSFADFPRLTSLISRDGFLPRSLFRQGDRLVFHNGIVALTLLAIGLIWLFKGQLDLLLPLYAVGVFTAFTLSQAGMVVHWWREKGPGWTRSTVINGTGALITGVVTVVIFVTKFAEGAWIVLLLLLALYGLFKAIHSRYAAISAQLVIRPGETIDLPSGRKTILLVPRVHRGILTALEYAREIDPYCLAVHIAINPKTVKDMVQAWNEFGRGVPLEIVSSPYRSLVTPILEYVDELTYYNPNDIITVIVPEAISSKPFQFLMMENVAGQLKAALGKRKNVIIANVRYFLD